MEDNKEMAGKISNIITLTEQMARRLIDNISDNKEKKLAKEIALIWGQEITQECDDMIRLLLDKDQLKQANRDDTDQTKAS